jgi:carbamoyl-phosphate synthase/aspartate carbamoyltransferase/dihydroorotase
MSFAQFKGKNITSATQFTRPIIEDVLKLAYKCRDLEVRGEPTDILRGKILAPLFYEESTRTNLSFCTAMVRLGGSALSINIGSSSVVKGETVSDTAQVISGYADVLVLRHPKPFALQDAVRVSRCPVLNAGNGTDEHPSQAMLDMFTMHQELGGIDGKKICLVGDLKHGRTVHSLTKLLCNFSGVHFYFVAPPSLKMPAEVAKYLSSKNLSFSEHEALTDDLLAAADVLYVTRVQKERFAKVEDYNAVKGCYVISKETLPKLKKKMCILHPLPRVDEITIDVDKDPRAAYFRQAQAGVHMRMALILMVLGKAEEFLTAPTSTKSKL